MSNHATATASQNQPKDGFWKQLELFLTALMEDFYRAALVWGEELSGEIIAARARAITRAFTELTKQVSILERIAMDADVVTADGRTVIEHGQCVAYSKMIEQIESL